MSSKRKIIFLDYDGPVAPTGVYTIDRMASHNRSVVSNMAIGCLNYLCDKTGARIVTNSTHNTHIVDGRTLFEDLVRHGIKQEYFYNGEDTPSTRTSYPLNDSRFDAISHWFKTNLDTTPQDYINHWVAFDDEKFTEWPNLIHTEFDEGITGKHLNKALTFFGKSPMLIW